VQPLFVQFLAYTNSKNAAASSKENSGGARLQKEPLSQLITNAQLLEV
jgi:hypothetical protein